MDSIVVFLDAVRVADREVECVREGDAGTVREYEMDTVREFPVNDKL